MSISSRSEAAVEENSDSKQISKATAAKKKEIWKLKKRKNCNKKQRETIKNKHLIFAFPFVWLKRDERESKRGWKRNGNFHLSVICCSCCWCVMFSFFRLLKNLFLNSIFWYFRFHFWLFCVCVCVERKMKIYFSFELKFSLFERLLLLLLLLWLLRCWSMHAYDGWVKLLPFSF